MESLALPVETIEQAIETKEQYMETDEQPMEAVETGEQPMSELLPATVEEALECVSDPTASTEIILELSAVPLESAAPEEWELDQPEDAQEETHVDDVATGDRKYIPPKKDRMEPLKMDMSRPPKMVMPLTSSQISLQCLECHIIFSDHKSKERHLKQSHPAEYEQCMLGDALFACYVCDRHFTNSSDLMLHQRAHTEKQPFKCPICGEAFSRSSELTLHKKVHFGQHGYSCSDCGKPCKTLTLLKYHRRTHTGERPYVCKECGKRFSMSKALQKHALAHLPEGEGGGIKPLTKAQLKKNNGAAAVKFPCSMCKATFKTAKTRLHHIKHKHSLCVTAPSSSTLAGQQAKPGQPIIAHDPMGQPTFLHMEPLGPLQQVDNIDTEQIRKLIESLGNVRKVNQVVILGQVPPHGQPLDLQQLQGMREHLQLNFTQPQVIELKKTGCGETKSMGLEQAKPQYESLEPIITLEPVISDGQMETPLLSHTQEVTYTMPAEDTGLTQTHEGEMIPQQLLGQIDQTVEEENTMIQTVSMEQLFCHSETIELGKTTEQSQTVVLEVTPSLIPILELEQTKTDQQRLMSASSLPTILFEQTSGQNQMVQEGNMHVPSLIPTVELKLMPLNNDKQEELSTSSLGPTVKFAQTPPGQTSQVGETATQMETLQLDQIHSNIGQTQQIGIGGQGSVEKSLLENTESEQQHILEKPCEGKKQTAQEQLIDKSASNNALNSREIQPGTQTSEILPPPSETKKAPQSSQLPVHLMSVQEFVKVRKRKQPNNSIMQGNMQQQQTVELKEKPTKRPKAKKALLVVKFGPKEKPKNLKKLPQPSKLIEKGDQIQDVDQMSFTTQPDKKMPLKKVSKEKKVKKKDYISKSKIKSPSILCDSQVQQVLQVEEQEQQVKPRKKKVKKQKDETHSEQISAEPISEQEVIAPPKSKKKKQQKIPQEDQPKKTKGLKLSKTGRKKKKQNVDASPISENMPNSEIKQQSLLLLKGHKQPQLKVYKLDASKAPQGQTDPQQDQDIHPIHKKKGPKSKQIKMLATGGKRNVGRPKKKHTVLSMLAPLKATSHSSDTSPTKPKTSRKRKAPKVETEGIISGSHSRRALECKDCGERFSDVSSLQEHKAALHAVESPGLTYTNGNIFEGVSRSDLGQPPLKLTEEVIENSLSQNTFGMQVASDWDIEVEMRDIGLGESVERVSFPALNPSPSLPLTAALVEGDGQKESEKNMDKTAEGMESFSHMAPDSTLSHSPPQVKFPYLTKYDKVQPLLSESLSPPHLTPITPLHSSHQTEDTKPENQGNMNDTADALIPTVSESAHLGPIEDEIKEELLLEVDLVTVGDGDQNEGEHQSSPHEDGSQNEGSSLHENNSTHARPAHAQNENVNRNVRTQNAQTESFPSDPLEIKQEEEEMMVQRREEEKREVRRKNSTRGRRRGVGRGRRGSATRKSLEGEAMKEMEPEKETDECQVVYQLYSLNNDTEIKDEADVTTLHPGQSSPISLQTEIRSISEQNALTVPCSSGSCIPPLEEDPEDQVVFELESVTTSVVEVLKTEDGMVRKGIAGDQDNRDNGQSPGIILERFLTSRQRGAAVGQNGVVLMADLRGQEVKVEENTSDLVPVLHTSYARHTVEQRGVRMYLVKQENNLVLNDPQVSQGHYQSQFNMEQSSARQCIFYPVKEEERELPEEPSQSEQGVPSLMVPGDARLNHPVENLSITNPAVEEYEVNRRTAKLGTEINEYGDGNLDFEQQDTEELVDFLLQNSDEVESEVVECSDPQPGPEAVVMACYHDSQNHASLHSNYIPNLPTTESQAHSGSTGGSQTGTGYRKPIDYFSKYFGWDAWPEIARCTNKVSHLSNPVTAKEVAQFVGIHIAMGTLKFPSLKLYWQDFTRVPLVADTMSASRFSQLSCKLQLASPAPEGDPMDTQEAGHSGNPQGPKEGDTTPNPLRALHTPANPTVGTIRAELDDRGHTLTSGHSQIQALGSKSVSAKPTTQMSTIPHSNWQRCGDIPSSFKTDPLWRVRPLLDHVRAGCLMLRREGDHGVDQYPLPLTCRAVNNKRPSLHSTVLVGLDGQILDFNLSLDLANKEATVEKMVPRDGMVYLCKQELSTPAMLEHLLEFGVHGVGKVGGAKGQMGDEFVSSDGLLMLHRYHLGFILSTVGKTQQNMASLVDSFEKAQKAARLNRDLLNLYHSPLSASAPTSWPQAVLWYLTDLALVNSWMQYREDHVPLPEPLNLMAFRLEVSKALILSSGSDTQDSAPPHSPQESHAPGTAPDPGLLEESPLPDMATRYDGSGHWPEQLGEGEGGMCRFGGCERMSRVRCLKCCVFLCISRNHNCFLNFHSQGSF